MDDLEKFCCQNKNCPKHGVRGEKNIRVRAIYGPSKSRLLYCLICKKKFSERRGTVLFDSRLPEEKVVSILEHVVEGNGMRKTGRLVKVDPETVSRYTKLAGGSIAEKRAEAIHDELVDVFPQAQPPRNEGDSIRRKVGFRSEKRKKL